MENTVLRHWLTFATRGQNILSKFIELTVTVVMEQGLKVNSSAWHNGCSIMPNPSDLVFLMCVWQTRYCHDYATICLCRVLPYNMCVYLRVMLFPNLKANKTEVLVSAVFYCSFHCLLLHPQPAVYFVAMFVSNCQVSPVWAQTEREKRDEQRQGELLDYLWVWFWWQILYGSCEHTAVRLDSTVFVL